LPQARFVEREFSELVSFNKKVELSPNVIADVTIRSDPCKPDRHLARAGGTPALTIFTIHAGIATPASAARFSFWSGFSGANVAG